MSAYSELIKSSSQQLAGQIPKPLDAAVILGTGMASICNTLLSAATTITEIDNAAIACLTPLSAPGHTGKISVAEVQGKTVAICQGRAHLYEGYSAQQVCTQVYLLQQLGAKELIITNASGALNPSFQPGEIMLIDDHINFTGHNPLTGQDETFGQSFTDMSEAYSKALLKKAAQAAKDNALVCHTGVYAGVTGPSLETSAERRMLRTLGADAVGMSTVLEVIAAKHCGMRVLGLSAITNMALGDDRQQVDTIADVLANAAIAAQGIEKIIVEVLSA